MKRYYLLIVNIINASKRACSLLAFCALLPVIACNKLVIDPPSGGGEISFGSTVEGNQPLTRGAAVTSATIGSMGVYASYTDNSWDATATPNYMFNTAVSRAGAGSPWSYSPLRYWPKAGNLSFFAYSPASSAANGIETVTTGSTPGAPSVRLTVPTESFNQADLLWAEPVKNRTNENPATPVNFTFEHKLAQVRFYFRSGYNNGSYRLKITAVRVKDVPSRATLNLDNGTLTPATGGDAVSRTLTASLTGNSLRDTLFAYSNEEYKEVTTVAGRFFVIPQNITPEIEIDIDLYVETSPGNFTKATPGDTPSFEVTSSPYSELGEGRLIKYYMSYSSNLFVIDVVSGTWTNVGNPNTL